jgi:Fic family protein
MLWDSPELGFHAQFETIHPFLDGNGRLGRILIILILLDKGVITQPAFFISEELEKNKHRYYGLLNNLRTAKPRWRDWLEFFVIAADNQATKNIEKLQKIEALYDSLLQYAIKNNIREDIIRFIFHKPVFTINEVATALGISYNTVNTHVNRLAAANEVFPDDRRRNRIFRFYDIIDILEH